MFLPRALEVASLEQSQTKTKLRGLSPRVNYTNRAAADGRRISATWSAQRIPTAVNLCFLDLEPLPFI
jgi:hypothetical protein